MVVGDLYVKCVAVDEAETDAPLFIDGYRMLPFSVTLEGMQSITGRRPEVVERGGDMYIFQAAYGPSDQIRGQPFRFALCEHLLGVFVRKRPDHTSHVNCHVTVVKRSLFGGRHLWIAKTS